MSYKVKTVIEEGTGEMRAAFCDTLINLAKEDERIFLMDADLMGAMGTKPFRAALPERTIDCGIQEANMFGVAGGLSSEGKIPFCHTFGVFATRRACDQIVLSCAYAKQNVKVIGSDPGVTAEINGGTHMPFEDMGIMRAVPGVTIVEPTDIVMIKDLLPKVAAIDGVVYLRLVRKTCKGIYEEGSTFEIGKANVLRDGTDATVIAMGYCVGEALLAAETLAAEGINVRVIDMFTLKPIDREAIVAAAKDTGAIVTAENHFVNNGLGSAVAEVLAEECPVPMVRLGSQDEFGQVGKKAVLAKHYGMDAEAIVAGVKKAIAKK